jgi:AraC-like DNA-binding protein/ligand-binding sensor protein
VFHSYSKLADVDNIGATRVGLGLGIRFNQDRIMETKPQSLDPDERIYRKLVDSPFFQTYRRAFMNATGLGLVLVPADEEVETAEQSGRFIAPFCQALHQNENGCRRCELEHRCIAREVGDKAETRTCFAGLRETLIPVKAGNKKVAYLSTGQVFTSKAADRDFSGVATQLGKAGFDQARLASLEKLWSETPDLGLERYEGIVTMLAAFALQLSDLLNRLLTEESNSEPQIVVKAKRFINAHLEEKLSLDAVAGHVGVSPFYFCKLFKQATDMTLTEYVNRRRVEWAKRKLINPNSRVTEVAFDVGFQSVSQFNRSFLKYVGVSPTRYRSKGEAAERFERAEAA